MKVDNREYRAAMKVLNDAHKGGKFLKHGEKTVEPTRRTSKHVAGRPKA